MDFQKEVLDSAYVYTISLPKSTDWEPERALQLMQFMCTQMGRITFRILAESGRIAWQVLDLRVQAEASFLARSIRAVYPEADIDVAPYAHPELVAPVHRSVVALKQFNAPYAPMKYVADAKKADPVVPVVQSMSGLQEGERIILTVHLNDHIPDSEYKKWQKQVTKGTITPFHFLSAEGIGAALGMAMSGNTRTDKFVPELQKLIEHRMRNMMLYNSYVLLQVDMLDEGATAGRLTNIVTAVFHQFASDHNYLLPSKPLEDVRVLLVETEDFEQRSSTIGLLGSWAEGRNQSHKKMRSVLADMELATIWHLPHEHFTAGEILWSPARRVPASDKVVRNTVGVLVGDNVFAGRESPIHLPDKDRDTHINIVGKSGVGKSTLMHNLIHRDIADGKGVGVIDPHGALVHDILRASIPDERIDDVVLLDIANEAYPPPLNPMAVTGDRGLSAAGRVLAVLDKMYGGLQETPRIADTLSSTLITLWLDDKPTVRDVARLFEDVDYRHGLLRRLDDIVGLEFWKSFERQSPGQQEQLSYPVIYRMRTFYGNPILYPMMCHPDTLDLAGLMSAGKIILLSLRADEEKVPPREQSLLGAVLVSQLQMAAMKAQTPFFLYIDEVQNFVTTALDKVLSEARKFGLSMTIANQFLKQLAGPTLDAVMGNVGTSIVFQVGVDDARVLKPYLAPEFSAEDLANLDRFHAAVKMRLEGETLSAFSIQTRGPVDTHPDGDGREQLIRQRSIEQYTPKSREDVLEWLEKRYPRPEFGPSEVQTEEGRGDDWVVASD